MRFKVAGTDAESGQKVDLTIEAPTPTEAEARAKGKGIVVESVEPADASLKGADTQGEASDRSPDPLVAAGEPCPA